MKFSCQYWNIKQFHNLKSKHNCKLIYSLMHIDPWTNLQNTHTQSMIEYKKIEF